MQLARGKQSDRGSGLLGFANNWNVPDLLAYSFADARSPNVSREEHFDRGGQRNGENGSKQTANQQSPDKKRDDDRHGGQPHGSADSAPCEKQTCGAVHTDKRCGDTSRRRATATLA